MKYTLSSLISSLLRILCIYLVSVSSHALAEDVAVMYVWPGYAGGSLSLPVGEYDTETLSATNIGIKSISSFTVADGYIVVLCTNDLNDANNCITYEESQYALGSFMGNKTSSIKVLSNNVYVTSLAEDAGEAFSSLSGHVDGSIPLAEWQLYAQKNTLDAVTEGNALSDNAALVQQGYELIQSYESIYGPLFTGSGTKTFSLWNSGSDGYNLERAMHSVYLSVFDAINSNLIASDYDLINGLEFGSATYFPGSIDAPSDPDAIYETQINASVPEDWGRPNSYSELAARRPTGTYVSPGAIAEVTVPAELIDAGFEIRVGAHSWDLSEKTTQKRMARASKLYPITSATTQVANPLGGNIYIEVPYLADAEMVTIQIKNAVRSPYFSARSFDQISELEWEAAERNQPAPWTDIETDKVMMSVPSKWVRDFSYADLTEILDKYDTHMDYISDFMGKPHVRNKTIVFMQVDVIFRGGSFAIGYPMGNYSVFDSATAVAPLDIEHPLNAAMLHEHGHATFMTKASASEKESLVHILYTHISSELYGEPLEEAFSSSMTYTQSTKHSMDHVFVSWALDDEFINGKDMGSDNASYQHRGYASYIEYVQQFGWSALTEFNRNLNVDYVNSGYFFAYNDHESNDRLLRMSREAGVDVRPLFHLWGNSPTDQSTLQASLDSEGLGQSAEIYDLMVAYKSTIPFTQDDYDAWYKNMNSMISPTQVAEFWAPLAVSYDLDRAQSAVDRIDDLIALYFPDGRPTEPTEPEPEETEPTEPEPEETEPTEPDIQEANPGESVAAYGADSDLDGVPDAIELAENTDATSTLSFKDSDSDGTPDFVDADSNGNGNWNMFESGAFPYYDRDRDGVPAYLDDNDFNSEIGNADYKVESLFDPDNNGIAQFLEVVVEALDADSDGVPDSVEAIDGTDTLDARSFLDFDSDTVPDYLDEDDDNDGILDVFEGSGDADEDGIANLFDTDSDGDGISDLEEGITDLNGDGLPNFLDATTNTLIAAVDQDGDNIADSVETTDDADQDSIANYLDTDSDNDGLSDLVETNADLDADGVPNYLDIDSDADNISDELEGMGDSDNDFLGNAIDYDSDADLIPDSVELSDDADGDGIPNYLDVDSDGDGVSDLLEGAQDTDGDGVPDYLDNDSDSDNSDVAAQAAINGTGSGCAIDSSVRRFDPFLFTILMICIAMIWRGRKVR